MAKIKPSTLARFVYGLVGITGIGSMIWAVTNLQTFMEMSTWSILAFSIAVIGSINWGIVTITNKRTEDLFGLLGL